MKYATKYMVVPYTQTGGGPVQDPEEYLIEKLDKEMSNILSQKINIDAKLKLYSQSLARFASIYQPGTFSLPSVLTDMAIKASSNEKKLSDKLDNINYKLENTKSEADLDPKIAIKLLSDKLDNYLKYESKSEQVDPLISIANLVKKRVPKLKKDTDISEKIITTKRKPTQTDFYQADGSSIPIKKKKVTGELSVEKKKKKKLQKVVNIENEPLYITAKPKNPIEDFESDTPINEESDLKFPTPPSSLNRFYQYINPSSYLSSSK